MAYDITLDDRKVQIPYRLLQELIQGCGYYLSLVNDVEAMNPEFKEMHPDWGAVEYLFSEARSHIVEAEAIRDDFTEIEQVTHSMEFSGQ